MAQSTPDWKAERDSKLKPNPELINNSKEEIEFFASVTAVNAEENEPAAKKTTARSKAKSDPDAEAPKPKRGRK